MHWEKITEPSCYITRHLKIIDPEQNKLIVVDINFWILILAPFAKT